MSDPWSVNQPTAKYPTIPSRHRSQQQQQPPTAAVVAVAVTLAAIVIVSCFALGSALGSDDGHQPKTKPSPTAQTVTPAPMQPIITSQPPSPSPSPSATKTTKAKTTKARTIVTGGAFCSTLGAIGYTTAGTRMKCQTASDGKKRWMKG